MGQKTSCRSLPRGASAEVAVVDFVRAAHYMLSGDAAGSAKAGPEVWNSSRAPAR
jgi:hypothetical protein